MYNSASFNSASQVQLNKREEYTIHRVAIYFLSNIFSGSSIFMYHDDSLPRETDEYMCEHPPSIMLGEYICNPITKPPVMEVL